MRSNAAGQCFPLQGTVSCHKSNFLANNSDRELFPGVRESSFHHGAISKSTGRQEMEGKIIILCNFKI
jgi:hypothetical protein